MTSRTHNVLVTGCGGDIGTSTFKILEASDWTGDVVGVDVEATGYGAHLFPTFRPIARADAPEFLAQLEALIEEHQIDLVVPTPEAEMKLFLHKGLRTVGRARLVMASAEVMALGFDKLETARFLERAGLPCPRTEALADHREPFGLPCILKAREGAGSNQVLVVHDRAAFDFHRDRHPYWIMQEYLSGDDQEYTCALYKSRGGEVRTFVVRRTLKGGHTGYGEVVQHEGIAQFLLDLAQRLEFSGSINVQLRLMDAGPMVFEINPRFSSTVYFRHAFGFQDLLWSLIETMGGSLPPPAPFVGGSFFRVDSEFIIKSPPSSEGLPPA